MSDKAFVGMDDIAVRVPQLLDEEQQAMFDITVTIRVIAGMIVVVMITWVHVISPSFRSITGLHASR